MGFGRQMLRQLEDKGIACGVRKVIATANAENNSSIAFHLKHGFRQCGQLTDIGERKGECFSVVLFEKDI